MFANGFYRKHGHSGLAEFIYLIERYAIKASENACGRSARELTAAYPKGTPLNQIPNAFDGKKVLDKNEN